MVSVCDAISLQQQASGWLQTLYVRGEVVSRARRMVRVYCACQVIHTYTTTHTHTGQEVVLTKARNFNVPG